MRRRTTVLSWAGGAAALVAVVALVLVTGHATGGGSSGSSGGGAGSSAESRGAPAGGTAGDAGVAPAAADPGSTSQAAATAGREVVRTATLAVTADDPSAAADRAGVVATGAGGRVDDDRRDGDATLTLRVPADRLDATLAQLAALGVETSRQVQGEDVTANVADLDARVTALQTSVDRLRGLITTAGSLADLLTVESQLTQRQADLESLQAQQRALADRVALATVQLTLTAPSPPAAATAGPTGFGGAVAGGWHGFTLVVRVLLAGLGYALPFLVVLGVVAAGGLLVTRRRRRVQPVASAAD